MVAGKEVVHILDGDDDKKWIQQRKTLSKTKPYLNFDRRHAFVPKVACTAFRHLMPFQSAYLCETDFSVLLSQRSGTS